MMLHHVTVALAGAAAHYMTGWALNSELVLGKIWKHEKDQKACGNLSQDMRVNIALQAFASLVLSVGLCVAIIIFEKAQLSMGSKSALEQLAHLFFSSNQQVKSMMHSMHVVLFIWAGFILPFSAEEVIWCGHNWKHWMLESVKHLISLSAIAITVTYLS
jgi:hypothetical protein